MVERHASVDSGRCVPVDSSSGCSAAPWSGRGDWLRSWSSSPTARVDRSTSPSGSRCSCRWASPSAACCGHRWHAAATRTRWSWPWASGSLLLLLPSIGGVLNQLQRPRFPDLDAVAGGRLSVAPRAGRDEPVRRLRPRPPARCGDGPPATPAARGDRRRGRVHRGRRNGLRGRGDRQRAGPARPDHAAGGLAFRSDRCRGRAPALRRGTERREERPG